LIDLLIIPHPTKRYRVAKGWKSYRKNLVFWAKNSWKYVVKK
jgi:hypothetical protein